MGSQRRQGVLHCHSDFPLHAVGLPLKPHSLEAPFCSSEGCCSSVLRFWKLLQTPVGIQVPWVASLGALCVARMRGRQTQLCVVRHGRGISWKDPIFPREELCSQVGCSRLFLRIRGLGGALSNDPVTVGVGAVQI